MLSLDQLSLGKQAIVTKMEAHDDIRRRLLDIGLIEGTRVECVLESPGRDPIAYQIRGAIIALRKEDSHRIMVRPI